MAEKKSLVAGALLALSVGAAPMAMAGSSAEVEKLLAQAQASLDVARAAGNSWTSTQKLMDAAREASDEGEALELARRALLTADKAREQSQLEQDAWQARVPSN